MSAAESSDPRNRRRPVSAPVAPESAAEPDQRTSDPNGAKTIARADPPPVIPTVLDFYPLEEPRFTELHAFFDHLRIGRFTTTKCVKDGKLLWPPRTVCPVCHGADLEWVDLPLTGRIYAFSAILAGAPLGMEADVPFSVGLVDLDGAPLRLFGRIEGRSWNELTIGTTVRVVPVDLPDGRVFYRFRVESTPSRR